MELQDLQEMVVDNIANRVARLTRRQQNILLAVVIFVMILIFGVMVYFFTRSGEAPPPGEQFIEPGTVRQPLGYNSRNKVNFKREVLSKEFNEFPQILEFSSEDNSRAIDELVAAMGGALRGPSESSGIFTWSNAKGDSVRYNSATDELSGFFIDGLDMKGNENTLFNSSNNLEFIKTVFNRYTGVSGDFTDINRKRFQNDTQFIATRLILGKKLVIHGDFGYTDVITVNSNGKIAAFKFYLLDDSKMRKQNVGLVSPSTLPQLLDRSDYPKQFNQKYPIGFDLKSVTESLKPRDESSVQSQDGPGIGDTIDFPKAESCQAQGIELVYYFQSKNDKYLTPTYKIDCLGLIYIGGYSYDVPISVFTSAIDPTYVYVPISRGS